MFLKENLKHNENKILSFPILFILIGLIIGTGVANFFILISIIIFFVIDKDNYKYLFNKYENIDKILLFFSYI